MYQLEKLWHYLTRYIDWFLFAGIILLMLVGLVVLYSATGSNISRVSNQAINMLVALGVMWLIANIPLQQILRLALPMYLIGISLLIGVALFGEIHNGARRWLDVGITRIQPSELMKIAVPLIMAWYFDKHEITLRLRDYAGAAILLLIPILLILRQPDLGTALLISASGFYVIFLAGLSWRVLAGLFVTAACSIPIIWSFMHGYQRQRVMTLLTRHKMHLVRVITPFSHLLQLAPAAWLVRVGLMGHKHNWISYLNAALILFSLFFQKNLDLSVMYCY